MYVYEPSRNQNEIFGPARCLGLGGDDQHLWATVALQLAPLVLLSHVQRGTNPSQILTQHVLRDYQEGNRVIHL